MLGQRLEGYVQDRYTVLPFLSVVFGLRFDYFNRIDELSVQPRGSILIELPNSSQFQFAYGTYNQTPQPPQLLESIGNPALKSSRASHYILELKRQLSQDTEIKMAAYYKDLTGLVTGDEEAAYLNQGEGYAQGTEVFLRHRSGERFSVGSLMRTPYPNVATGRVNPTVSTRLIRHMSLRSLQVIILHLLGSSGQNGSIGAVTPIHRV